MIQRNHKVNCSECKEQVLELIEREAVDPDGVRETLAECPDCRAEFDAVKASLALAQQLPIEEPPPPLDALILQAAEARTTEVRAAPAESKVVVLQPRRGWNQLAVAAVALLVVGIGVSTVSVVTRPADERLAQAPSPQETSPAAAPPADFEDADEAEAVGRVLEEVSREKLAAPPPEEKNVPASRRARATRPRSPKKKEARGATPQPSATLAQADESQQLAMVEAEVDARQDEMEELAPLRTAGGKSSPASTTKNGAKASEDAASDQTRRCVSKVSAFETRLEDDEDYAPSPEEQLSAGLCYQTLKKHKHAQRWLKRAAQHSSTSARAKKALEQLD